jgi:guanine nucleotide-binding protein G(i) subunit alpha
MGCVSSSSESPGDMPKEDKDRSYAIDKQIDDDAKKFRRECKILLLGKLLSGVPEAWGKG